MLRELADDRVSASQIDSAHGDCYVNGKDVNVWVDTSCLAIGLVIENGGAITVYASWLRPVHKYRHINMAEHDAVL